MGTRRTQTSSQTFWQKFREIFPKSSEKFFQKFREIFQKVPRDFSKSSERFSQKVLNFLSELLCMVARRGIDMEYTLERREEEEKCRYPTRVKEKNARSGNSLVGPINEKTPLKERVLLEEKCKVGSESGARSHDLRIMNPAL